MKSTWFGCRHRYEFARLLQDSSPHTHTYETFGAFLEIATGSLRQAVHKFATGEMDDTIEQHVIKEQGKLKHADNVAHAFGILTCALEETPYDFLGTVMSELSMNDAKWRGQCFTPPALSECIARMTLQEVQPDPNHRLTLNEPCCGGGSILIAASQILKEKGFYPWNYWWVAQDIDWRCVAMTYVQCTLLAIPAVVVHGNTLAVEARTAWPTIMAAMHPYRKENGRILTRPVVMEEADATELPEWIQGDLFEGLLDGICEKVA